MSFNSIINKLKVASVTVQIFAIPLIDIFRCVKNLTGLLKTAKFKNSELS